MIKHKWLGENKSIPVLVVATDGLNIVTSKVAQQALLDAVKKKLKLR